MLLAGRGLEGPVRRIWCDSRSFGGRSSIDGRRYNRGVRLHKIMYEAFIRLTWPGFVARIEENHKESKATIDSFFNAIGELNDDIYETQFEKQMTSTSSVDFVKFFDKYMEFLWHENGNLLKVWLSYLAMVEILPRISRASREGNCSSIGLQYKMLKNE